MLSVLLGVWGAAVIADSGVFSTALSETADQRMIGTALTAQTAFGFLLTIGSIQLVPLIAMVTGWQFAFVPLVIGPIIGAWAMARFGRPSPPAAEVSEASGACLVLLGQDGSRRVALRHGPDRLDAGSSSSLTRRGPPRDRVALSLGVRWCSRR